jgi:chromosome partitioning protein
MQKIVVLNPKGGSGKTTVATSLASYFATQGLNPTLMDMDVQGSSTRWLSKRAMERQPVHGIATFEKNSRVTRSFALRIPEHCQRVVVDTPAALDKQMMPDVTRDAHAILVPVLPSDIDIHAVTKCITNLLLVAKIPRETQRIGVIANRVKKNTVMYRSLMRFLGSLNIPILTSLRDSQNYIRAFDEGIGIFEMKPHQVREDLEQWLPLIGWLAQKDSADAGQVVDHSVNNIYLPSTPITSTQLTPEPAPAQAMQRPIAPLQSSPSIPEFLRSVAAAPLKNQEQTVVAHKETVEQPVTSNVAPAPEPNNPFLSNSTVGSSPRGMTVARNSVVENSAVNKSSTVLGIFDFFKRKF